MVYLIDASVYVFRSYYAVQADMRDTQGNAVHALYGFARFISDLVERARPRYMAVAFDASLATSYRNRIYPAYKANREPAPPDLALQFARCRELCTHLGIAHFDSPEYEADDIIGTLVTRMRAEGLRTTVVTRDKDLAQLVREGDIYWDFPSLARYQYLEMAERFGVAPERYADYLALTGDAVDNIPGVPGVGPKTAAVLMTAFATLEQLYDGLEQVASLPLRGAATLAAKLAQHREAAYLARRLTAIHCEMPLQITREQLARRAPDSAALNRFFDAQGFGNLLRRQAERMSLAAA